MRWMCCSSRIVFSPGHCSVVICVLLLLIKNMYSLLSGDRGYTIMYPFTLLVFECIHYMIGTLAIHPDHKTYLTLHEIWFLEKCNHRLGDCFLLSGSEIGAGRKNVSNVSFITELFSTRVLFHCVACLIEALLKIAMILLSFWQGFLRVNTASALPWSQDEFDCSQHKERICAVHWTLIHKC